MYAASAALAAAAGKAAGAIAAGERGSVGVFDALTGHLRHVEKDLGQSPWQFLTP